MIRGWPSLLLVAFGGVPAQEDLRSVTYWFQKADAGLSWFEARDKQPVDATYSVMLVQAAPLEQLRGLPKPTPAWERTRFGVFVVYGKTNQVYMVIDIYAKTINDAYARIEEKPSNAAIYLHFYSDYGFYHGSTKYVYDLGRRTPAKKLFYGRLGATAGALAGAKLHYVLTFGDSGQPLEGLSPRRLLLELQPGQGEALPSYQIREPGAAEAASPEAVQQPEGVRVERSGIALSGRTEFFPVPVPDRTLHRKLREPGRYVSRVPMPAELMNEIGPFALDGDTVWFANSFYDGEGMSGVGAIGTFSLATRSYRMRYLPEIAAWSGSALLADGDEIWIGLMRRPEGAAYGGGLLGFNRRTNRVRQYPMKDYIHSIHRAGEALYLGTSHGVYLLRSGRLTQLRFEPDSSGQLVMVGRELE